MQAACMLLTLETLKTTGGRHLFPNCLLVSNLGGMGSGHLRGQFASFAVVRGDDGDLSETSASVLRLTSPVLLGSLLRKVQTVPRDALNPSPLGSRQAGNVEQLTATRSFPIDRDCV